MNTIDRSEMSRRDFLKATAVGGLCAASSIAFSQPIIDGDYGPFHMGFQSYTMRAFGLDAALDMTRGFGLHYWESFQAHIGMTPDMAKISENLAKLKMHDIRLSGWGVQGFDADAAKSRKVFEFAKSMKVRTITADPRPESFDSLEKLTEEFKINIAIHNHGPGASYDKIAGVEAAIKNRSPRIGACVDTGHYLRSGEDPVEAVKRFGRRVFSVHLKDVKGKTEFTEVGNGDLRTVDLFRELKRLNYKYIVALEYEEHEKDPVKYIDMCLAGTKDAISKALAKA